ncbi:alanine--tRNA ligase [Candidatus Marinamargulisbacteria bacterium SCGC AG-414-C22]|nr:alanine--tRNA ligase [Candidatus Marinamargulisbacteria bacterium SCGC AG-414-C22]
MKSAEVRKKFINFFQNKQHTAVNSCPVIPDNDPSLLFINAGMNQFKDVFLGDGQRPYSRAVNSQVCIRVSGKHNDLEDVGRDSTHLTSFEMLGNWSFGDYYKEEAITWAWELFTDVFNIPKSKLVASVFEDDEESLALWKDRTDINPKHIVKCDAKDNFWEMGATGPCGPCSEIHVYLGEDPIDFNVTQESLNSGDFIELWNLVFIQFDRQADGQLVNLPQQHVDTGAGLERLVAFMQKTSSNYQTDLLKPIIDQIVELTEVPYQESDAGMAHRVMTDHIRTLCFGIADSVVPSNEGRGYVLRRLLRRACRYAKQLGVEAPILYQLVPTVVAILGDHFTHLKSREAYIQKIVKAEEESFLRTLSSGLSLFDQLIETYKNNKKAIISGADAFKLYDTYGFPLDLTELLATENGLRIDHKGYQIELAKQQERSRQGSKFEDQTNTVVQDVVTANHFTGLPLHLAEDLMVAKGGEARIIANRDEKVAMAKHHTATHLLHEILRQQLGDHVQQAGSLVDSNRLRFDFSHFEALKSTELLEVEQNVNQLINKKLDVSVSFSTLTAAKQQGVMALFGEKYDADRVRVVDIGGVSVELCAGTHVHNTEYIEHFKIISESAIAAGTRRVEAIAGTENIMSYLHEIYTVMHKKISDQLTKCVQLSNSLPDDLKHTIDKIKVAIDKTTINSSIELIEHNIKALESLQKECQSLAKRIQKHTDKSGQKKSQELAQSLTDHIISVTDNVFMLTQTIGEAAMTDCRLIADELTMENNRLIVVLASVHNKKGQLLIKCGSQIDTDSYSAVNIIKQVTTEFGGGGGGRPNMAQAGGVSVKKLTEVIQKSKEIITSISVG